MTDARTRHGRGLIVVILLAIIFFTILFVANVIVLLKV